MPFNAWKHTERNRQRDRKKYAMISWGFVIPAVQNNSLNDSTYHSLEPTLLGDMPIKFIGKNFVHFSIGIKH